MKKDWKEDEHFGQLLVATMSFGRGSPPLVRLGCKVGKNNQKRLSQRSHLAQSRLGPAEPCSANVQFSVVRHFRGIPKAWP
jgi:hypothetical protein